MQSEAQLLDSTEDCLFSISVLQHVKKTPDLKE